MAGRLISSADITTANGSLSLTSRRQQGNFNPLLKPVASSPPSTVTLGKGDGVFTASVSSGGTGYAVNDLVTLTGGTFSTAAVLKVTSVSAGVITGVSIDTNGVYSVNPSSPASQGSTTGVGTGATFTITMSTAAASSMSNKIEWAQSSNGSFRMNFVEPRINISSSGYFGNASYLGTHASIEFWSDAPDVNVQLLAFNTGFDVWVNNERVQSGGFSTNASGSGWVLRLAYATAVPRLYRITGANLGFARVYTGSAYSVWAPTEVRRPLAYVLGDSYTFGTGATSTGQNWVNVFAEALGMDVIPDGIGGTGWNSTSTNAVSARISGNMLLRGQNPQYVFLALGYNDAGGNMATLAANIATAVTQIRTGLPLAKICILGPWTPTGDTVNLTTVDSTIQAAAATAGVTFVSARGIITSNNKSIYTGGDNVHPTQAGHEFLGGVMAQRVSPYMVSLN